LPFRSALLIYTRPSLPPFPSSLCLIRQSARFIQRPASSSTIFHILRIRSPPVPPYSNPPAQAQAQAQSQNRRNPPLSKPPQSRHNGTPSPRSYCSNGRIPCHLRDIPFLSAGCHAVAKGHVRTQANNRGPTAPRCPLPQVRREGRRGVGDTRKSLRSLRHRMLLT